MQIQPPGAETQRVRILYTNDVHGTISPVQDRVILGHKAELGGSAYLASVVERSRAEDPGCTLLLDSGDAVHGQMSTDLDQGRSMVDVMNEVGYDASTIGNHDFQWGVPTMVDRLGGAEYPVVIANVTMEDGSTIPHTQPSRLFELDGVKVGVTGVLTTETAERAKTERIQGVKFSDEAEAIRTQAHRLREQGADVVLVMSHMGLDRDTEVARKLAGEGIVFLGGHSHDRIHQPIEVAGNLIVQSGYQGKEVGQLDLRVERRRITSASNKLIPVDPASIEPDPEVAALVKKYEDRADREMGKTLARLDHRLTRSNNTDSPLGRMVTDAMRQAVGAQIALINSDGLRTDLEAGPLTAKDLYGVMPFGGDVVIGTLTGAQILEALELSASRREKDHTIESPFLQVSGMRFAYDASKPNGQRILEAFVGDEPLDPKKGYTVALDDYLAAGKIGYTSFKDGHWQPDGVPMLTAMVDAIKAGNLPHDEPNRIEDRTP